MARVRSLACLSAASRSRGVGGGWRGKIGGAAASALACALAAGLPAQATAIPAGMSAGPTRTTPTFAATEWPAYLDGPLHTSYSAAETAITPANAPELKQKWHFKGGDGFLASPIVADGAVYIGANNGWFYKLGEMTGKVLARIFLGTVTVTSCPPPPSGIVSTATVAVDPVSNQLTVYVSGADGYLYALSASSLQVEWKSVIGLPYNSQNSYFDWSSPTVANGRIYIGVASNCDTPLVRGGLISYSQKTGRKLGEFYTVPKGQVGGSIWSSIGVAPNGDIYATTGNGPESEQLLAYSESILKLSPTLKLLGHFQIPSSQVDFDSDFGASPVFWEHYVGACNKNGTFYALYQWSMKLAWEKKVSGPSGAVAACIATPVWNGKHLFFATYTYTIHGVSYAGSVQERNPGGKLIWATGLIDGVDGSPSMDGGGVLAVGTFDTASNPNATYLIDAANGTILRQLVDDQEFAQSAFADNWLFTANYSGVYAWGIGKPA